MISYEWKPIEDLSENWCDYVSPGLDSLASVWLEQSGRLKRSAGYDEFISKLCREWAIETGVLERLYSIDRGITVVLIEKGIEAALIPHGSTDKPAGRDRDHSEGSSGCSAGCVRLRQPKQGPDHELHKGTALIPDTASGHCRGGQFTGGTDDYRSSEGRIQAASEQPVAPGWKASTTTARRSTLQPRWSGL